jgi:hypothetical protein
MQLRWQLLLLFEGLGRGSFLKQPHWQHLH